MHSENRPILLNRAFPPRDSTYFAVVVLPAGLVMVAHGMARRHLILQFSFAASSTLAVIIGAQHSVHAIAIALVISHYVGLVPSMLYCFRGTPVSPGGFFKALVRPFAGSVLVLVVGGLVLIGLPAGPLRLFIGSAACAAAYVLMWWLVPPMRRRATELLSIIVKKLRPGKKRPT